MIAIQVKAMLGVFHGQNCCAVTAFVLHTCCVRWSRVLLPEAVCIPAYIFVPRSTAISALPQVSMHVSGIAATCELRCLHFMSCQVANTQTSNQYQRSLSQSSSESARLNARVQQLHSDLMAAGMKLDEADRQLSHQAATICDLQQERELLIQECEHLRSRCESGRFSSTEATYRHERLLPVHAISLYMHVIDHSLQQHHSRCWMLQCTKDA